VSQAERTVINLSGSTFDVYSLSRMRIGRRIRYYIYSHILKLQLLTKTDAVSCYSILTTQFIRQQVLIIPWHAVWADIPHSRPISSYTLPCGTLYAFIHHPLTSRSLTLSLSLSCPYSVSYSRSLNISLAVGTSVAVSQRVCLFASNGVQHDALWIIITMI